jgi:hypothetical protein
MRSSAGRRAPPSLPERPAAGDNHTYRVINGVTGGSAGWFILSSIITNGIITVSLARLVSGRPVPERKVIVTVAALTWPDALTTGRTQSS